MLTSGQLLSAARKAKRISLKKAAADLHLKSEHLKAIEDGNWQILPEPAFVKGFIRTYAEYLGLSSEHVLALYRREYDEAKYPQKRSVFAKRKKLMFTPDKLGPLAFILAIFIFISYLALQYTSILSTPKLEIFTPTDDITTNVPYVIVSGKIEKETTLAINGQFVPKDPQGNFTYQLALRDGKNVIEIIASKRLSPKAKVTRTVRLIR